MLLPARLLAVALAGTLAGAACPSDAVDPAAPPAADAPVGRAAAAPPDTSASDGGAVALAPAAVRRLVAADPLWADALRIHFDAIVVDGHVDTPTLMLDAGYDATVRNATAHVDFPRMAEGGLDAAFFAVYVSRAYGERREATERALAMIAVVEAQVAASGGQAELARTAADVRRIARAGRRAVLLGLENGNALRGQPEVLQELAARGVRYVTLTHTGSHSWADSSQDRPAHGGLTDVGRALVAEMNRLGVLVDVSHVSSATLRDAVAASRAPVIASHSSARALVDNVRNLTDDEMRAIAATGGVVMLNAYAPTVNGALTPDVMAAAYARVEREHAGDLRFLWDAVAAEQAARGLREATLADYLDHVAHAVRTAGAAHVGLGTDFDGVPRLPDGLDDATRLPWVTHGLLARGLSEADVRAVLGGNTLRVLEAAEAVAREMTAAPR